MKLSDIRGERTLEVIAEVIDPIANIAADQVAAELFTRKKVPQGVQPRQFLLQRIQAAVPALVKDHKADIIAILSALEGVSSEEYTSSLNLVKLIRDFTELLTDEVFTTLFISAQSDTSSGSVQETTTGTTV